MNEKYWGRWVWNKSMFVKDPETGKRTAMRRPDLAIVDDDLWKRV